MRLVPIAELSPAEADLALVEAVAIDGTRLPIPDGLAIPPGSPWPTDSQDRRAFLGKTRHGRVFVEMKQLQERRTANLPDPDVYQQLPSGLRHSRIEWERQGAELEERRRNPPPPPAWLAAEGRKTGKLRALRAFPQDFDIKAERLIRDAAKAGPLPHNTELAEATLEALGYKPAQVKANRAYAAVRIGDLLEVLGLRQRQKRRKR